MGFLVLVHTILQVILQWHSRVHIMSSMISTCFNNRSAVKVVWANAIDDDFSPLDEGFQFLPIELYSQNL